MDKQAQEAKKLVKDMSFSEKISHFWYYYKFHTIAVLVIALLIGVTVHQALTKEKYDLKIAYYGSVAFSDEQAEALRVYLPDYIEDIDENGEKTVSVSIQSVGSEAVDQSYRMAVMQKLWAEIAAGVNSIYILDEEFYNQLASDEENLKIMQSVINVQDSPKLKELLKWGDKPLYWCTTAKSSDSSQLTGNDDAHKNAELAENAIK